MTDVPQRAQMEAARSSPRRLEAVRAIDAAALSSDALRRLTRVAARALEAPVCYLALVADGSSDLVSAHGLGGTVSRTLKGIGLGHYSIATQEALVADSTASEAAWRDSADAKELGLQSFAAVSLRAQNGEAVGCLCAGDRKPRNWTLQQIEVLTELAASAEREIGLREVLREASRYREQVREAAERQEKIRSTLAHDLRTPLSIIKLSTHTLTKIVGPDKGAEIIERMLRAANRMAEMIDSLLDTAVRREPPGADPGGQRPPDPD